MILRKELLYFLQKHFIKIQFKRSYLNTELKQHINKDLVKVEEEEEEGKVIQLYIKEKGLLKIIIDYNLPNQMVL